MEFNEIDVFVGPDGEVKVEIRGVKGNGCLALTRELEAALGGEVSRREMTSEALDSSTTTEQNQLWQSGS